MMPSDPEPYGASADQLRAFMEHSPLLAFLKDAEGRYVYVNARFEQVFGVVARSLYGKADVDWLPPRIAANVQQNDRRVLDTGETIEVTEVVPTPDGADRYWLVNKFLLSDQAGARFVGGVALDVTSLKQAELQLRESEQRYRVLVEQSGGLMCTHDLAGTVLTVNAASLAILGYTAPEVIGRNLSDLLDGDVRNEFPRYLERMQLAGSDVGLMLVRTRLGELRAWQYHNVLQHSDDKPYVLGHAQDVTELRETQEKLRALSVTDDLTGLLNRRGFFARATRMLQSLSAASCATLFYVDIDYLKRVNDTFGHDAGSAIIAATAGALSHTFRAADIVARIGGDEFIVLAEISPEAAPMIVRRLNAHLLQVSERDSLKWPLKVSVGTASFSGGDSTTLEELITAADASMYQQKLARKDLR